MINLDHLDTFNDLALYIRAYGADAFLMDFHNIYPEEAKKLSNAVLSDHAQDYDKKKAALLRGTKGG